MSPNLFPSPPPSLSLFLFLFSHANANRNRNLIQKHKRWQSNEIDGHHLTGEVTIVCGRKVNNQTSSTTTPNLISNYSNRFHFYLSFFGFRIDKIANQMPYKETRRTHGWHRHIPTESNQHVIELKMHVRGLRMRIAQTRPESLTCIRVHVKCFLCL